LQTSENTAKKINDSAFEDLGRTLGELISKYGAVENIGDDWNGAFDIYFENTAIGFCFSSVDIPYPHDTSFTEDELKAQNTGSLRTSMSEIFPDIKATISTKELAETYKLNINSEIDEMDGLYVTYVEYDKYFMYIHSETSGEITSTDYVHVKIIDN